MHMFENRLNLKHLCVTKVSLQRDLRSKAQHLQRDMCLEVHLMTLCIHSSLLLFYV